MNQGKSQEKNGLRFTSASQILSKYSKLEESVMGNAMFTFPHPVVQKIIPEGWLKIELIFAQKEGLSLPCWGVIMELILISLVPSTMSDTY